MPIPGEAWGAINKYEKPKVGGREFDVRETLVTNAMSDAANEMFVPKVNVSEELYAAILRKESDTIVPVGSKTEPLSRFRCYVFSGPYSEIPFDLTTLGYSNPSSQAQVKLDDLTTEMFPVFTCKNKDLSDRLKGNKEGYIVKVVYGNRENLSEPLIVDVTSFAPLVPESSKLTITQFRTNTNNGTSRNATFQRQTTATGQQTTSANVNRNDRFRRRSLATFNNQSLSLNWPTPGRQINIDFGKTVVPSTIGTNKIRFRFHRGIDISGKLNEDVFSAAKGVIVAATRGRNFGLYVRIRSRKNNKVFDTIYAHLNKISVRVGQKVGENQKIGELGSTGNSVGPHLHFELRFGNAVRDPIPHFRNSPVPIYSPLPDTQRRVQ